MECPQPTPQHKWLRQLIGSWEFEGGDENMKTLGTETVRSLGDLWVIMEGETEIAGGPKGKMQMTLGFDPAIGKFVGHWIGSMMTNQWVYEGELDATGQILTLNTTGPTWEEGQAGQAVYQDIIELHPDGRRVLRSMMQKADGTWMEFMVANYRRTS